MKLLLISILWVISTVAVIWFSLYNLIHYPKKNVLNNNADSPRAFVLSGYILDKSQIPHNISPEKDIRYLALKKFLQDKKSPLENDTDELIKQADIWGLDYALLPAIAMQESGGCKNIPDGSYNCWGFGIYGNKKIVFTSYKEAIAVIAQTIKESYIKSGLTNATLVEDLWAPPSKGQWSYSVNYFIGKIKEYERNIPGT